MPFAAAVPAVKVQAKLIAAVTIVAAASLAGLVAAVPVPAGRLPSTSRTAASSGSGSAGLAVLDLVVLVDESGSETLKKVADEKATVGTIIQSQLNPASRVTVIGFGGINGVTPNEVATNVACVPTIAGGAANLAYLSTCYSSLRRRSERQGDDTDYAAALGRALTYLNPDSTATPPSPHKAIKVILMMTDGAVDVHRDPRYGPASAARQVAEKAAVSRQLAIAKADQVQFWALGFGTDIGNIDGTNITKAQALTYLNIMASQGAPEACPGGDVGPHATWVNSPDDAVGALDVLYATAGCLGENSVTGRLAGGQSLTFRVSIPPIVSAAAISVARGSPDVRVAFTPPPGAQATDSSAISGQEASVEVLHLASVTAADVGTWDITLTAPSGLARELAGASVFWQGTVRVLVTANPRGARAGQEIHVTLGLLGRSGPLTDAAALNGLSVGVTATGTDLPGPRNVPIGPVSGQPGKWAGTFTSPDRAGTVTFQGVVKFLSRAAGAGLYVTQVPQSVVITKPPPGFVFPWWLVFFATFIALVTSIAVHRVAAQG